MKEIGINRGKYGFAGFQVHTGIEVPEQACTIQWVLAFQLDTLILLCVRKERFLLDRRDDFDGLLCDH